MGLAEAGISALLHNTPPTVTPAEAVFSAIVSTLNVVPTEADVVAVIDVPAVIDPAVAVILPADVDMFPVADSVPVTAVLPPIVAAPLDLIAPVISKATVGLAFNMPT